MFCDLNSYNTSGLLKDQFRTAQLLYLFVIYRFTVVPIILQND